MLETGNLIMTAETFCISRLWCLGIDGEECIYDGATVELLFNLGRRISSALSACDPQKFPFRLASANKRDRKADRLETKTKRNARESLKVISPDDFIDVFYDFSWRPFSLEPEQSWWSQKSSSISSNACGLVRARISLSISGLRSLRLDSNANSTAV